MSTCLFIVVGEGVCSAACVRGSEATGRSQFSWFTKRSRDGTLARRLNSKSPPRSRFTGHFFFFNFSFSVLEMEPRDKQSPTELYVPHSSMYLSIFETESY